MDIVRFSPEQHPELSTIWSKYGWKTPSIEVLPRTGFVSIDQGKIVAAAFVYRSCSGMALLDWVVADPDAPSIQRGKAVFSVIRACKDHAINSGSKVLYTVTANQSLISTYKKMGFDPMETNATSLAMSLDGTALDFLKE